MMIVRFTIRLCDGPRAFAPSLRTRNPPISCCATGSPPIPTDPDKPAEVKGVADIAPADVATAIKFCKKPRRQLAPGDVSARPRLCRQPADGGSDRRLAQGGRQGLDLGNGRARRALWHRRRRRQGRGARRANCSSAPPKAGNPRGVTNLAALSAAAPRLPIRRGPGELLAKAAETNAEAQYQLGLMLADGAGGREGRRRRPRAVRKGGGTEPSRRAGADGRVRAGRPRRTKGQGGGQGLLTSAPPISATSRPRPN